MLAVALGEVEIFAAESLDRLRLGRFVVAHDGIDPTVARYDGEVYGGDSLERAEMKLAVAPIDYVRDQEPLTPTSGGLTGDTGGTDTDYDLGWP